MLRFSDLLRGQVEDEIPYNALKDLLRALSSHHPQYPRDSPFAFSQTQTPIPSQSSIPFSTPQVFQCDRIIADGIDLQPKTLFPDSEIGNSTPTERRQHVSVEKNELLSDASRELQPLLQNVAAVACLTAEHAHLVGQVVNEAVLHLTELGRSSGTKSSVSFEDARSYLHVKSEQIGEFLDVLCDENFMYDDVIASVSDVDCVQVFYSVQFWEYSWRNYMSEVQCEHGVRDDRNASNGVSTGG